VLRQSCVCSLTGTVTVTVQLLNMLNNELPPEGLTCLENYFLVRHRFVSELPPRHKTEVVELEKFNPNKEAQPSHEILIREVCAIYNARLVLLQFINIDAAVPQADEAMDLAEQLLTEGFSYEASQNYHTACIYYKVMMAMVPTVQANVQPKLQNAANMARYAASLTRNFVREHFAHGRTCADVYEVHGASKLGKGSYGSVYLSTHRITGDERAVKVMNVDRVTSYYLRSVTPNAVVCTFVLSSLLCLRLTITESCTRRLRSSSRWTTPTSSSCRTCSSVNAPSTW
jgi:hypothetical protein